MSRLEEIKEPGEELKKAYAGAVALGWVDADGGPNAYMRTLSSRPDLIQGFLDLTHAVMMRGELPLTVKAMVFYTIAARAKCEFCAVANHKALQMMGVPDDVISSCARDPELADVPPSQREIIKFAVKAEENPKTLTDADFQVLRDQGLSDGEIAELILMAGYAGMLDICADALGLEVG